MDTGRRLNHLFFGLFFWLWMAAMLVWWPTACRPTGPKPGDDKTVNTEKQVNPDGNVTGDDGVRPTERNTGKEEKPQPKELTIMDIQDPSSPKHVKKGAPVILKGVVVVSPMFVASKNTGLQGFFVADGTFPTKKWGGIMVVVDKDFNQKLAIGDKLDIEGSVDEYSANTQIVAGASRGGSVTKTGTVPAADIKAVVVKPEDIPAAPDATDPDASKAEPYEGVLVELQNVTVEETADKYGLWKITGGVVVDDNFFKGFKPNKGDTLKFVRGILYYSFNLYRLIPRNSKDIDGAQPQCDAQKPCGVGQKCENEQCVFIKCTADGDCNTGEKCNTITSRCEPPKQTVTVMDVQNPQAAKHVATGTPVELKGVIATSALFDVSANLKGFFVSDPSFPKQWGGVMVVISKTWTETLQIGDELDLFGRVEEFYNNTQIKIDLTKDGKATKTGQNMAAKVVPIAITPADLPSTPADPKKPDESKSEALEGSLVELKDVTVSAAPNKNGEWQIDGGLIVDDTLYKATVAVGDKFSILRGVVQFSFGKYRILPRSADDLKKAP